MSEKLVSVVIPCYNVQEYLPRCTQSLLEQTIGLENLELIFVDDGSTDGTLEYLYQLEQEAPSSITVVACPENQKQGAARNIGLGYATGKYVGFVDADDWVLPQMYEEMYQKAEETDCELVTSYLSKASVPRGRFQGEDKDLVFQVDEGQRRELLVKGMTAFVTINVWSKLFLRKFLEEHSLRFGEGYAFEDTYFSNMTAFYVKRFCVMQAEYYHYTVRQGSVTTSMDCGKWFWNRYIMVNWVKECIDRGLFGAYYQEIEMAFIRDYYVSNLNYVFTHTDKDMIPVVQGTQAVTRKLFPKAGENTYIQHSPCRYFHRCQEGFFTYLSRDFYPGEITKTKEEYRIKLSKIAAERDKPEGINEKCEEITVMLAADRNYLYPAMVLITSLFENHPGQKVVVYLLQIGYSGKELEAVQALASQYEGKKIHCLEVGEKPLSTLKAFGRFSVATYFRILGMRLVPATVGKILYLDVDTIVNRNLSELFSRRLNAPLAACYSIAAYLQGDLETRRAALGLPPQYAYFNAGMLLMDLQYMREQDIAGKLLTAIEKHFDQYTLKDNDAMNMCFYKNVEYLPWEEYNCPCIPFLSSSPDAHKLESLMVFPEFYYQRGGGQRLGLDYYDITNAIIGNAGIIHYCTVQKPWDAQCRPFYGYENMKAAIGIYRKYQQLYADKTAP